MIEHETIVRLFFESYEALLNQGLQSPPEAGGKEISRCFAGYFVAANPSGVSGRKNGMKFRWSVPRSLVRYREAGLKSINLTSVTVLPVDQWHVLARVSWDIKYYVKGDQEERSAFTNHYLLQVLAGEPKILAAISGEEPKVIKERGAFC